MLVHWVGMTALTWQLKALLCACVCGVGVRACVFVCVCVCVCGEGSIIFKNMLVGPSSQ